MVLSVFFLSRAEFPFPDFSWPRRHTACRDCLREEAPVFLQFVGVLFCPTPCLLRMRELSEDGGSVCPCFLRFLLTIAAHERRNVCRVFCERCGHLSVRRFFGDVRVLKKKCVGCAARESQLRTSFDDFLAFWRVRVRCAFGMTDEPCSRDRELVSDWERG